MLYQLFKKLGPLTLSLLFIFFSISFSVFLTLILLELIKGKFDAVTLLISVIVPSIVAPIPIILLLKMLIQLDRTEKKLRMLTVKDHLTEAYNRKYFIEVANMELARAKRYGSVFAVLMIDVDNFKRINDTYGHLVGDEVLRVLGKICIKNIRLNDIFARYGGEEFIFLLPQCDESEALRTGERIRHVLENARVTCSDETVHFTVSVGVAVFKNCENCTLDTLLKRSDDALYAAKKHGRNCVVSK